ncbi:MAG TPA: hypothetical protein VIL37_08240 [Natronosporangium sp.]
MTAFPLRDRPGDGGAVVITMFNCRTRRNVLLVWWLHYRIKPAIQRVKGFLDVRLFIDWRRRIVRSVSLWTDPAALYDLGEVGPHVAATRLPSRFGIETSCGFYQYEGDCGAVMFGVRPNRKPNPITLAHPSQPDHHPE